MDLTKKFKFSRENPLSISNGLTFFTIGLISVVVLTLAFASAKQDSLTFDELAHIGAGYSYLTQQDYRLNPEHPPLAKDLAALPLLFLNLNFPSQSESWLQTKDAPAWWVQYNFGNELLFHSGNNPQDIIFWARFPIILLYFALGIFIFFWARKLFKNLGGTLTFLLYAFSPTLLAHGRLVTTDVAAAFGAVLATYFWIQFLQRPSKRNVIFAGIAFGVALCLKFTLLLLVPFFSIISFVYPFLLPIKNMARTPLFFQYILKALFAGMIGLIFVVWPIYQFHIWNYPASHQVRDTISDLSGDKLTILEKATVFMADKPGLRPFAQFARGVLMAGQRVAGGNTTYFEGQISATAWKNYFPVLFFSKEPLALYALLLAALAGLFISLRKKLSTWIQTHFFIFSCIVFLFIYWLSAIIGNLNIGIRHLLPTFPFLYFFISWGILELLHRINQKSFQAIGVGGIVALYMWFIISSIRAFPSYISYYNELAGGTQNGYKIAVDSNYDWGQDFYKLLDLVKKYNITKLHVDYFGGEDSSYWLKEIYVPLNPQTKTANPKGWIAVSINQLLGGHSKAVKGFNQDTHYYDWLTNDYFVARAGTSIFLYYIP